MNIHYFPNAPRIHICSTKSKKKLVHCIFIYRIQCKHLMEKSSGMLDPRGISVNVILFHNVFINRYLCTIKRSVAKENMTLYIRSIRPGATKFLLSETVILCMIRYHHQETRILWTSQEVISNVNKMKGNGYMLKYIFRSKQNNFNFLSVMFYKT